ncbi:uncharacterized protein MONBRDRAFT_23479 [Monosiga brevicollis MX1]|uniref:RNase H type-1 domain-containing protein n=1 Tax=Monosiga brevicollis TaxID=81824 RepID=A9UTJ2_MONBE|nr:uncharacterized protein MONBRDRAFT_23479 [Monosiga brevicollis MX1]EDQ91257.1 predicted protein [Monosiga brevicollis MX1]|eukprot:XP_001743679.1 hypothetical protein [Monosiga brevicollis MX1]
MPSPWTLHFDGGARDNKRGSGGPAGAGALLKDQHGAVVIKVAKFHPGWTNNEAEYMGLIMGLRAATLFKPPAGLQVVGDSQLIVRQMQGQYAVKSATLKPFFDHARSIALPCEMNMTHTLRHNNAEADALANLAMDKQCSFIEVEQPGTELTSNQRAWILGGLGVPSSCSPLGTVSADASEPPAKCAKLDEPSSLHQVIASFAQNLGTMEGHMAMLEQQVARVDYARDGDALSVLTAQLATRVEALNRRFALLQQQQQLQRQQQQQHQQK